MTWEEFNRNLNAFYSWLLSQPEGTVAWSTMAQWVEYVTWLRDWMQRNQQVDPQTKAGWVNHLSSFLATAQSRRCRGIELLGVCGGTGARREF